MSIQTAEDHVTVLVHVPVKTKKIHRAKKIFFKKLTFCHNVKSFEKKK